jgi:hypothetical protein
MFVIPAKAGIGLINYNVFLFQSPIPAFAGMTKDPFRITECYIYMKLGGNSPFPRKGVPTKWAEYG